jgi:hypothetical protein
MGVRGETSGEPWGCQGEGVPCGFPPLGSKTRWFDLPSAPFLISAWGSPWGGGEIRNGADGAPQGLWPGRGGGAAVVGRTVAARRVAGLCGC